MTAIAKVPRITITPSWPFVAVFELGQPFLEAKALLVEVAVLPLPRRSAGEEPAHAARVHAQPLPTFHDLHTVRLDAHQHDEFAQARGRLVLAPA
jgi:hypothetical protein